MTELVLEQVFKFIEMVLKDENDFEISEFYRSRTFQKIEKWCDFLKISKFLENESGRGSCHSSFPSGNQVDGSPLVAIITPRAGDSPSQEKSNSKGRRFLSKRRVIPKQ